MPRREEPERGDLRSVLPRHPSDRGGRHSELSKIVIDLVDTGRHVDRLHAEADAEGDRGLAAISHPVRRHRRVMDGLAWLELVDHRFRLDLVAIAEGVELADVEGLDLALGENAPVRRVEEVDLLVA